MTEEMTDEELMKKLEQIAGTTPTPDEKHSAFSFLNNVALADDTTKLGYLKDEELGNPRLPIRTNKSLALIAGSLMENEFIEEYFRKESEITTSTSLSRDGFLVKQTTLQKKEIADTTKPRKINKGWFKKKDESEQY